MKKQASQCWSCPYSDILNNGTIYCTKMNYNCNSQLDCTIFDCRDCVHSFVTEADDVFDSELYCKLHGYPCEQINTCKDYEATGDDK